MNGFAELARRVPLCERGLREAVRRGQIPSIRCLRHLNQFQNEVMVFGIEVG